MCFRHILSVNQQREVLGHATTFHNVNAHLLQSLGKRAKRVVAIELAAEVMRPRGPREDGRDGVGGGGFLPCWCWR